MADTILAPASIGSLIDSLRQLRLLSPADLEAVAADSRHGEPKVLARSLIERGLLTPYQCNLLFQGRGSELLLEPYVVLQRLGEGGTGLVLKARHMRMQRVVAIKLIRRDLLKDADIVARFQREIEVASQVSHPNVVHAFDAGPMGNTLGLVMEYVEGTDLNQLLKDNGPLPLARACDYIRQAAQGLQHTHECGLVHRDIKPSNLLVASAKGPRGKDGESGSSASWSTAADANPWGVVKLLDLGLARLTGRKAQHLGASQLTSMGSVMMGTPDYMAPEQALDLRGADIRADIYSLGCTLYFLLTGQPPFPAGTLAQKLMKHQAAPPQSPRQLRPELPAELDPIFFKMLDKLPDDRYQTPIEVARAMAAFVGGAAPVSVSITTPTTLQKTVPTAQAVRPSRGDVPHLRRRWWGRRSIQWSAAALLLAAGVMLAVSALSGPRPVVERPKTTDTVANGPPPPITLIGDPRGRHYGSVNTVAYSPNGNLIASGGHGQAIHIWDAATLGEIKSLPIQGRFVQALAFAPDGNRLATALGSGPKGEPSELKVWDLHLGKEIYSWAHGGFPGNAVAFSGDGGSVSLVHMKVTGASIDFRVWELASGKEKRPPLEVEASFAGRLSANGNFGLSSGQSGWKHWDLTRGVTEFKGDFGPNGGMPPHALSADGATLLTVRQASANNAMVNELQSFNLKLPAADLPGDARRQVHHIAEEYGATLVAASPRPNIVAVYGRANDGSKNVGALRVYDISAAPRRLAQATLPQWVSGMMFAPDGRTLLLLTNDGCLRLWDAATLTERLPQTGHRGTIASLGFVDSDQALVSTCNMDHSARLWDPVTGKERAVLTMVPPTAGAGLRLDTHFNTSRGAEAPGVILWNHQGFRSWDAVANKTRDVYLGEEEGINALAVSPDGRTVAIASGGNLKFWDAATGASKYAPIPHLLVHNAMNFSQDGKFLATPGQRIGNGVGPMQIRVLEVATGKDVFASPPPVQNVQSLALSGDGRFLAGCVIANRGQQECKLWEVVTGKERAVLRAPPLGYSILQFAPTGPHLALWNHQALEIWDADVAKVRCKINLQPPQGMMGRGIGLRGIAFSRDGRRFVFATNDGRLVLQDCAAEAPIQEWKLPGVSFGLALSADGKQVAVGSQNGLMHVYRVTPPGQ